MSNDGKHTILLGGIGGDSHSVGLTILRQALEDRHQLLYLGTQNQVEEFFKYAGLCNLVMISCMDGHARRYLTQFPKLLQQYKQGHVRWYLGGNLTIGDGFGYERLFLEMGFSRVFPKFVDLNTVLECIERDLSGVPCIPLSEDKWEKMLPTYLGSYSAQSEEKIDPSAFRKSRREVLETWRTGADAKDMEANAEFLSRQPSFAQRQLEVLYGHRPMLIQPRSGVPLVDKQIELFRVFKAIGVSVLSYQVDSYTRNNDYAAAEEEIRHSSLFESTVNGFPVINHGIGGLRRIISEVDCPLQTRHSTREPRLLAEISYAGGVTSFEGGAICYNVPYYKDYPLSQSIPAWQYVDRLTGLYREEFGIVLDREFFGTLTATLIPPSLAIVTGILEALLAIQQGVRCVSIGYAEQGHRIQDIAAIRTLQTMAKEIIENAGYKGVQINSVFHQYMAAFPPLPHMAEELIYQSAITASLSGATRLITKTPVEAYKIPTLRDNIEGLQINFAGVRGAMEERVDDARVEAESAIIRREVQSMFDGVVMAGHGNIANGIVKAFNEGLLDIPFAPSVYNRGAVLTARDTEGAVRFLRCGHLPFDRELREFHADRMAARFRVEGHTPGRDDNTLVERDVLQVARGSYDHWPLAK